jgi:hypothetical protein
MAWEPPSDDPGMGERLLQENHIGSPQQLMNCSTCHR